MKKRTKALQITREVKHRVFARDNGLCVLCGLQGLPEAHYISRAKGGLGIEQNIVTLCRKCHHDLDQTVRRRELLRKVKSHLDLWYPDFPDERRVYRK